jgi:hypothetical protein
LEFIKAKEEKKIFQDKRLGLITRINVGVRFGNGDYELILLNLVNRLGKVRRRREMF